VLIAAGCVWRPAPPFVLNLKQKQLPLAPGHIEGYYSPRFADAPSRAMTSFVAGAQEATMLKKISLLALIVVALTVLTCYAFHRLTPTAPCDPKEITLISGFWLLAVGLVAALCRWIRSLWTKKATPVGD